MNGSWWIFVKQVLIEGYLIDWGGGVKVVSQIVKITQNLHK